MMCRRDWEGVKALMECGRTKMYSRWTVVLLTAVFCNVALGDDRNLEGTVAFASVGRAHYAFDIYYIPLRQFPEYSVAGEEVVITDGHSVNYNGQFLEGPGLEPLLEKLNTTITQPVENVLAYVSEREGIAQLYLNIYFKHGLQLLAPKIDGGSGNRRRESEIGDRFSWVTKELSALIEEENGVAVSLKDRPALAGENLVYVSTHQPSPTPRESWAAVYSTHTRTGRTRRLTPRRVADLSPAVSPSGEWVMVASHGERGWHGEIHDLETDLYLFNASDGSQRKLVVRHGGWPSWADNSTVYFHRQADDGWWSVYEAVLPKSFFLGISEESVTVRRITPPGIHAFTPAASRTRRWIAVATRRPDSDYRHIEIFDLVRGEFVEVTKRVSPNSHHYNPFVSHDSDGIGYHKCRGGGDRIPVLEYVKSPLHERLSVYRIDGTFPSYSPDGSLIAYIPSLDTGGVYVMSLDGSGRRKIFSGMAFGTAWDWKKPGVVYASHGRGFTSEKTTVDIVAIFNVSVEEAEIAYKTLTKEGNNAFPSPSPDGKFVVFRSGRSGHKNLYIMDAEKGEEGGLWQLTEGPWTDTMCSWSPSGEWIAFASDRDDPGSGSFALYFIRPDGTGLRKVLNSSTGGRVNHPSFSPDSKSLVFTSDYAGVSAESISVPHQYQPYGEIFIAKVDGSDLLRLTHNAYEDGTPSWGRIFIGPSDLVGEGDRPKCDFYDDMWLERSNGELIESTGC